ncbi:hypothetical protein STRCI_006475 [Streptomyces cinnabarinus]|uniref:Secreted protein n=1 Tax=Streptomyces cinnabarinus TaxID=67287 RepID=A0ABY7KLW9_9ACTN|nr:hypothetical protein [Streptomyces cinnabarinus]WAZ25013.1 hypothetical protein STRCI_006475 [Streptomyces cinnabarinus]
MRIRTRGAGAALLLTLALAVTGCGSGGAGDKAADLAGEANAQDEMAVKFAECLGEHGVSVETGEGGGIRITGQVPKEQVDAAMEACREYSPMQNGAGQDPQAEERMRKMAQCMRDNGVEDFPDPEPGRGIQLDRGVADDPDFEQAQKECDKYAPSGSRRSTDTQGDD